MTLPPLSLPSDLASAHVALLAERAARVQAEAEAANAKARLSSTEALIAHLQLLIGKLERAKHGPSREHTQRLIDQLELQLEELAASATEDELVAEEAAAKTQAMRAFTRKRPVRQPWPDDIECERIVLNAPTARACCGGSRLSKLGEDVTRTLEEIPHRFKVIETVREKFSCRDCEAISQVLAPFHATPRGFIGPNLLATIVFDKFGQHIPLNRQSTRFKCEGIDLSTQTLADQAHAGVTCLKTASVLIRPSNGVTTAGSNGVCLTGFSTQWLAIRTWSGCQSMPRSSGRRRKRLADAAKGGTASPGSRSLPWGIWQQNPCRSGCTRAAGPLPSRPRTAERHGSGLRPGARIAGQASACRPCL